LYKNRDAEDHIAWLVQHGWHEKALAAVEAGQGRTELLDEVYYNLIKIIRHLSGDQIVNIKGLVDLGLFMFFN
jgi:hypothetical protein